MAGWRGWVAGALLFAAPGLLWAQASNRDGSAGDPTREMELPVNGDGGGNGYPLAETAGGISLRWSGYLKPVVVFETKDFGALGIQPRERFTTVGVRTKLRLDGSIRDTAQFHSVYNIAFNGVDQETDTASTESNSGDVRLVESYIDFPGSVVRWRVGAQQKAFGFFNGFVKPTDRVHARDFRFLSSETEDTKLPETGVELAVGRERHHLSLFYIPAGKVNKLHPDSIRFLRFMGYDEENIENPKANSSNSKYVFQYAGSAGNFSYALTYVDGINPRQDLASDGFEVLTVDDDGETIEPERRIESAVNGRAVFHRYHSPALDLQYVVGDAKFKFGYVFFDTADNSDGGDGLKQNDWYEWLTGVEFKAGESIYDIHFGQKIVPNLDFEREFTPNDPVRKRLYFQNLLLSQPRDITNILVFKYRSNFLEGGWLEFTEDFVLHTDTRGEVVVYGSRTDFSFHVAEGLIVTFRPGLFRSLEVTRQEAFFEIEYNF